MDCTSDSKREDNHMDFLTGLAVGDVVAIDRDLFTAYRFRKVLRT
jgi:hypothetical protein